MDEHEMLLRAIAEHTHVNRLYRFDSLAHKAVQWAAEEIDRLRAANANQDNAINELNKEVARLRTRLSDARSTIAQNDPKEMGW